MVMMFRNRLSISIESVGSDRSDRFFLRGGEEATDEAPLSMGAGAAMRHPTGVSTRSEDSEISMWLEVEEGGFEGKESREFMPSIKDVTPEPSIYTISLVHLYNYKY